MNTETENETVPEVPDTEATPAPVATENAENSDTDDDEQEESDSHGDETSEEARRDKPKRPRWSDVNRANREALEARRELDQLRQQVYQQQAPVQEAPVQSVEKPTLESCNFDTERYAEAIADWRIDQRETQRTQQQSVQERTTQFATAEAEFTKANPDYEGVAKAPNVPITQQMAAVMLDSPDTAPAVAYYLGQNIEECARIAQMTPIAAARAIGRIEAKFAATPTKPPVPPKPVMRAPAVVPTLQPGSSASKDWKQMSTEEHVKAYREKREANRR